MLLAQDIRSLPRSSQERFATAAVVAGIHVVVIAGIIVSLGRSAPPPPHELTLMPPRPVITHEDPLPPPDPTLVKPKVDPVKPIMDIAREDGARTITAPSTPDTGPVDPPPVRIMPARAIMGTHTTPDYPPLDARQGHEGNVLLKLTIDEWGAVTDAQVERSSGYEGLDRAAASWVKSHWLYHPATRSGDAIPSTTEAVVTFRLTTH
jgi:protein TonB